MASITTIVAYRLDVELASRNQSYSNVAVPAVSSSIVISLTNEQTDLGTRSSAFPSRDRGRNLQKRRPNYAPIPAKTHTVSTSIVALVTRSGKVTIINLLSRECEVEYPGNKYRRIIAPPDGTYVLVQTIDGEIFRLNATNPFGLELYPASVMGQCVAMSSDGQLLASGSGRDIRLRVAEFNSDRKSVV